MPLRVLAIRTLTGATVARAFLFAGISTSFFIGVLYLQHVRGFTAMQTGLAFLPTTATLAVLSAGITARLMARVGPRNLLFVGMPLIIAAFSVLALAGDQTPYFPTLLVAYAMLGIGGGISFMPLLTISMSEVPMQDAGLASGFSNEVMQIGAALGLAAIGTVATDRAQVLMDSGSSIRSALTGGYELAFVLAAFSVALGLSMVAIVLRPAPSRTANVEAREPEAEAA
jgi:MFS family permease